MFIPNNTGTLYRQTSTNIDGEKSFGTGGAMRCAIVKLDAMALSTTVRTDSSATRGAADEKVIVAKILFPATYTPPSADDRFDIVGYKLKVMSVHPRFSVTGKLDHYECGFEVWVG